MAAPPRAEWPLALVGAARLLAAARLALALPALPGYLLLRLVAAVSSAPAFDSPAPGSRLKHAALVLPRLAALLVGAPAALAGAACAAEVLAQSGNLGWTSGLAAALAGLLTLHGLLFVHGHRWLPESWRLEPARLLDGAHGALDDLLCCCALCLVVATAVRLPVLLVDACRSLCGRDAAPRGRLRALAHRNARVALLDILCLPALVLVVVCFWRLGPALKVLAVGSSAAGTSAAEGVQAALAERLELWGQALGGLVDAACACLAAPLVLAPWRLAAVVWGRELGEDWRYAVLEQLLCLIVDILSLPALVLVSVCAWRLRPASGALAGTCGRQGLAVTLEKRLELLGHALGGLADAACACLAALLVLNPWRLVAAVRGRELAEDWRPRVLASLLCLLLVDVPTLPLLVCLLLLPWRLALALRDLVRSPVRGSEGQGRSWLVVPGHLLLGLLDVVAAAVALPVALSHRRKRMPPPPCCDLGDGAREEWEGGAKQCMVLAEFAQLVWDICWLVAQVCVCAVPVAGVALTLYRVPALISGLPGASSKRCFLWRQFGLVLIELPIAALSICLVAVPWRFCWLVFDLRAAEAASDAYWAVFHHVRLALADLLSVAALLVLLLTAPHRLLGARFRWGLRSGLQPAHLGMSATAARNLRLRQPQPRVPEDGSAVVAFHGTTAAAAAKIREEGFRPSPQGMLGPGVYCSRDLSKAESYGDGTVLKVAVTIGRVAVVDRQGHPDQQDWASKGYDLAWVPAGCGMVPSNREEGCVGDPAMIRVIGEFERARHPHLLCLREALGGLLDLAVCVPPLLVLVLTVYRLPALWRHSQRAGATPWEARCFCLCQALHVALDAAAVCAALAAAILLLALAVVSPWRLAFAVLGVPRGAASGEAPADPAAAADCEAAAGPEAQPSACGADGSAPGWGAQVLLGAAALAATVLGQLLLALLDLACAAALVLVAATGLRAHVLWAALSRGADTSAGWLRGCVCGGLGPHCAVLRLLALVLLDLAVLAGALLVALMAVRLPSLCRRAAAMLEAKGRQSDEPPPPATAAWPNEPPPPPPLADLRRGLQRMSCLDGEGSEAGPATLSFFQELVFEELAASVLRLPGLLLAPLLLLLPAAWLAEAHAHQRFGHEDGRSPQSGGARAAAEEAAAADPQASGDDVLRACAAPRSARLAAAVLALLRLARPGGAGPGLLGLEARALAGVLAQCLLLLHEAAALVSVVLGLAVILPQTLCFGFWPAPCRASAAGRSVLEAAHVVQLLLLPATLSLGVALLLAPLLLNWRVRATLRPVGFEAEGEGVLSLAALAPLQVAWALVLALALEMLFGLFRGRGYRPLRGGRVAAGELLGLASGRSGVWRRSVDPCFGALVHFSYRHRRTCWCAGELLVAVELIAFVAWPLAAVAAATGGGERDTGERSARWCAGTLAAVFLLFHAVRIAKCHWRSQPGGAPAAAVPAPFPGAPPPRALGAAREGPAVAGGGGVEGSFPAGPAARAPPRARSPRGGVQLWEQPEVPPAGPGAGWGACCAGCA